LTERAICTSGTKPDAARWRWRLAAAALILATAGLRISYFAHDCPLDLAPDEAHYWDWSRHLDWSYYSKGPLVAWLIRLSCVLTEQWSRDLTGSEMLAVRLPAIACGCLILVSLYLLAFQVFRRDSLAFGVAAAALCSPLIAAGSSLMTIDAPYACCWGWALVVGHQAIFRQRSWAWPVLGLIIGAGILAKYTMVFWIPSVLLFLLFTPQYRPLLFRRGPWIAVALAAACCLPILIWNLGHDGMTFRHVSGQAGLAGEAVLRWRGPFEYIAVQFAILLGFWFCAWLLALYRFRPRTGIDPAVAYLWWTSVPMFVVFFFFSFITTIQPNWPVTAYLSGLVLAAGWLAEQLTSVETSKSRNAKICIAAACTLGLALIVFVHHTEWFHPALAPLVGEPTESRPHPLRRMDPTCRLRGWQFLACQLELLRERLRGEGIDPILAGSNWTLPGEVAFYCPDNPAVYSLGLVLGDRHSQYDLWHPNPVSDPDYFEGRTFILVGDTHPYLTDAFDQVDTPQRVDYLVDGRPVASWKLTVCRGFHGFKTKASQSRPF
jgi:hypothetical protein